MSTRPELEKELRRQEELAALLEQREKLECEQSLAAFFARIVWPATEGERKLEWPWPIPLLCKNAEEVMRGTRVNRWIVNLAVRCGKSTILSVALPCWWWVKNPAYKFAFYSYGLKLRRDLAKKREQVLRSEKFQKYWGDRVKLPVRTSLENLTNFEGGEFLLMGPGSTGHGGDAIIVDDPTSGRQARFENQLQAQEDHVREVVFSRLNNRTGPIIVVQQRQDPEDLSGTLSAEEGWHSTVIPPIFDEDTRIEIFDGTHLKVKKGTLADPTRFGRETLEEMRRRLGSRAYEAEILQKPPTGEEIVRLEWLKPWEGVARAEMDAVILSVDTASVGRKGHSRWGITVWGVKNWRRTRWINDVPASEYVNLYFLLAVYTRYCEYADARQLLKRLAAEHKANGIWVESATQGIPLAQELTRAGVAGLKLININKLGNKANRLTVATVPMEDGRVYVPETPEGKALLEDLRKCRRRLPENDPAWDNADSASLFLNESERCPGINALVQMKNWAAQFGEEGQTELPQLSPTGCDPFTPQGYVHQFDLKKAAQNLLLEGASEPTYAMRSPDGDVWDVTEDEVGKLLEEGWVYEIQTQAKG